MNHDLTLDLDVLSEIADEHDFYAAEADGLCVDIDDEIAAHFWPTEEVGVFTFRVWRGDFVIVTLAEGTVSSVQEARELFDRLAMQAKD